jgi:hypothetical protein
MTKRVRAKKSWVPRGTFRAILNHMIYVVLAHASPKNTWGSDRLALKIKVLALGQKFELKIYKTMRCNFSRIAPK